jgi:hypothetical protein
MLYYAFSRKLPVQIVIGANKEAIISEKHLTARLGQTAVVGYSGRHLASRKLLGLRGPPRSILLLAGCVVRFAYMWCWALTPSTAPTHLQSPL